MAERGEGPCLAEEAKGQQLGGLNWGVGLIDFVCLVYGLTLLCKRKICSAVGGVERGITRECNVPLQ